MAAQHNPIYARALRLIARFDDEFLELASLLRELKDNQLEDFNALIAERFLSRRTAFYLLTVYQTFGDIAQTQRVRLSQIGWTKLMVIAAHVTSKNREKLLKLAEAHPVWKTRRMGMTKSVRAIRTRAAKIRKPTLNNSRKIPDADHEPERLGICCVRTERGGTPDGLSTRKGLWRETLGPAGDAKLIRNSCYPAGGVALQNFELAADLFDLFRIVQRVQQCTSSS